ncbi:hypothetical protein, partial [Leucobacter sp. M11]|uniref:hypothetical protein n=1 Tax=Leucobacter sp. M11 TaxID=2993565 RepID=UPI002D7EF862
EPHFAPEWLLARLGAAEQHLRDAAEVIAGPAGAEGWTGWSPEIAFFGDLEWSIRFATAPEGGELGVLVTLTDTEITGAQSLDAEGDPGDERERGDADPDE